MAADPANSEYPIRDAMNIYVRSTADALMRARKTIGSLISVGNPNSRQMEDLVTYLRILNAANTAEPITATEYQSLTITGPTNKFVVCSSQEATEILIAGSPKLPIVVLARLNPESSRRLNLSEYLEVLQARQWIQIHDFQQDAAGVKLPTTLSSEEAIQRLKSNDSAPINMVDLVT